MSPFIYFYGSSMYRKRAELVPFVKITPLFGPVSHCGTRAFSPENTIVVAEAHWKFNVRMTKGSKLVLMCDDTLVCTTNVEKFFPDWAEWRVQDFPLGEIRQLLVFCGGAPQCHFLEKSAPRADHALGRGADIHPLRGFSGETEKMDVMSSISHETIGYIKQVTFEDPGRPYTLFLTALTACVDLDGGYTP